jgi:hypothetical protein
MVKLCKECKFYNRGLKADWCTHTSFGISNITGGEKMYTCQSVRQSKICGRDAKLFEKKPTIWQHVKTLIMND